MHHIFEMPLHFFIGLVQVLSIKFTQWQSLQTIFSYHILFYIHEQNYTQKAIVPCVPLFRKVQIEEKYDIFV